MATDEIVGKGCLCIYPFEKHYVALALKELIDEEEKHLRELEEKERTGDLPEVVSGLKNIHEKYVSELKIVRDRFANMTDC